MHVCEETTLDWQKNYMYVRKLDWQKNHQKGLEVTKLGVHTGQGRVCVPQAKVKTVMIIEHWVEHTEYKIFSTQ